MMNKKRDLANMEKSVEESPKNVKRLKLAGGVKDHSDEMHINGRKLSDNKHELADAVKTRAHCRRESTVENVKTILRYVLANESVLAMVQKSMKKQKKKCEPEAGSQIESTEPEVNVVETPWPILTPKKPDVSQKLLEEEYSEESASDEDYQPNEEELSDEDVSLSFVGTEDLNSSTNDKCTSPPLKPSEPLSEDEDALVIALPETKACNEEEVDKIAERTRSKVCLNDIPLETLESSFIPPDITKDMYNTDCDGAYKEFICEFTKPLNQASGVGSVADDTEDEKDPWYDFREEAEDDEEYEDISYDENALGLGEDMQFLIPQILESAQQDKEDYSFLEELSITFSGIEKSDNNLEKEEIKSMTEEDNENNSHVEPSTNDTETNLIENDIIGKENTSSSQELEVTENTPKSAEDISSSPVHVENVRKEWIIQDERLQLDEQMRMHVQLLSQSYLLSHAFPNLQFINESSKRYLDEIKLLASISVTKNQRSAFFAHNLDEAIDVVNKMGEQKKGKPKKMNKGIPDYVKKVLAASKVFIYPELLPKYGFHTFFCGSKATFSTAEDNLIALGLEQFSYMEDPVPCIQEHMLPTKSAHQIRCRIKNSKQKRETENAITHFCKHNKLPEFHRVIRIFDPNNVKAPEKYPPSALPAWMESFSSAHSEPKNIEKQNSSKKTRPKFILPHIQIAPTFIQELRPLDSQGNPQPVICQVYSVNEKKAKGGSGLMLPKRINRKRKRLLKNQKCKGTQFPESPGSEPDSHFSEPNKQKAHSEETSDEEIVEYDDDSDSSSDSSFKLPNHVHKKNHSSRKCNVVTRSMSTNHETCQTESSCNDTTETFHSVSVKEEPISGDEECHEKISAACAATHSEATKSRTLKDSVHKNLNQLQVDYSMLTEHSLRIVTSHGYESSDSEQSIAECNELLVPFQNFHGSASEDAVLPPASNSVQKHQPSDFSAIRNIISSEEKRKKLLDSDKTKVRPKKASKSKKNWTMKEDQLIISNCQRYGINKRAFRASADEIGALTPLKVKQRFIYLLRLLSEKLQTGNK